MNDGWLIRAASSADATAMWELESQVFQTDAWSLAMMQDELTAQHRFYAVLEDPEGNLRGYGGLFAVGAEGDIQTIAIDGAARGQGRGRVMMNALLDAAHERHVEDVFLEVRADNPAARSLYVSLGFVEIAVRPNYYQPDGVDAIVMKLEMQDRK